MLRGAAGRDASCCEPSFLVLQVSDNFARRSSASRRTCAAVLHGQPRMRLARHIKVGNQSDGSSWSSIHYCVNVARS